MKYLIILMFVVACGKDNTQPQAPVSHDPLYKICHESPEECAKEGYPTPTPTP